LENESNGCVNYSCYNESGSFAIPHCVNVDNITICDSTKCIEEKQLKDKKWKVELEIDSDLWTPDEISEELSNKTNIEKDDMTIGIEYNDKGTINRIIVYVEDENQARRIETLVRNCAP